MFASPDDERLKKGPCLLGQLLPPVLFTANLAAGQTDGAADV
jgi:hypothetical protein